MNLYMPKPENLTAIQVVLATKVTLLRHSEVYLKFTLFTVIRDVKGITERDKIGTRVLFK